MEFCISRLKFIFPKNILLTIYKSLFVPHINYGSLVWGNNFEAISKLQKEQFEQLHIVITLPIQSPYLNS